MPDYVIDYAMWLVVCGLAILVESLAVGLVSIWFAVGAFVTAIIGVVFHPGFLSQLVIFSFVSFACLVGFLIFSKFQ